MKSGSSNDRSIEFERWHYGRPGSLRGFIEAAWNFVEPGNPHLSNWHEDAICEHLEAVTRREIRKLVLNIPPACEKSLLVQVFWPAWKWIVNPGLRTISASYDVKLTTRDARRSLAILQSEWFRARWGVTCTIASEVSVTDYANLQGGWRFSTSVAGKMTGRHCDDLVVDDPVKPLETSKVALDRCLQWWRETASTRFRDFRSGCKVIMMQRLHEGDLAGEVLKEEGWEHVRLPMRFEPKAISITSLGVVDRRTKEGELLWPGRIPEEQVKQLEKDLGGRGTAAQLQQRPSPEGGAIFKREWFKVWTTLPKLTQIVISCDATFKDTDGTDYVAIQVWGATGKGDFFKIYQERNHMGFEATCEALLSLKRKFPTATILIEDKANGPAIVEVLKKKVAGVLAINPEGGKEARAHAVSPLYEAGNIHHPDPSKDDLEDCCREEMLSFPMGKNDDQVDATTQALLWLYRREMNYAGFVKGLERLRL